MTFAWRVAVGVTGGVGIAFAAMPIIEPRYPAPAYVPISIGIILGLAGTAVSMAFWPPKHPK